MIYRKVKKQIEDWVNNNICNAFLITRVRQVGKSAKTLNTK